MVTAAQAAARMALRILLDPAEEEA